MGPLGSEGEKGDPGDPVSSPLRLFQVKVKIDLEESLFCVSSLSCEKERVLYER